MLLTCNRARPLCWPLLFPARSGVSRKRSSFELDNQFQLGQASVAADVLDERLLNGNYCAEDPELRYLA